MVSVSEVAFDRPVVRVISGPDAPVDIALTADPSIQISGWNPAPAALDRSGRLGPRPAPPAASSFPPPWPIQLSVLHPRKDQAPVSFVISSVRRQLLAAFAAVSLLFVVAIVLGWTSIGSVNSKVQAGAKQLPMLEQATGHARDMVASEADVVLDPRVAQDHLGDVQTFRQTAATLAGYATTPKGRAAVKTLNAALAKWVALDDQVVALARAHRTAKATELVNGAANDAADKLTTAVQNVSARDLERER